MDRKLIAPGEFDYDYANDILFFKIKEREYSYSVELGELVIDFDDEQFLVGLQVFNASGFFDLPKTVLRDLKHFQFNSKIKDRILNLKLTFTTMSRNKVIEHKPIIYQKINEDIPNSELICNI